MKYKDYYQALEIDRDATPEQIKKAYRKLAHKYHPDISKDPKGEEKFKEIAEAYATLKDPEKRQEYDNLGRHSPGETFTPPPDWATHFGADQSAFGDMDLGDLFSAFSGGRRGGRGTGGKVAVAGDDYQVPVPVSLETVHAGGEVNVSVDLPEYDQHGLPRRVHKTFRIMIPKGAEDGQRLRLAGKGGQGRNGGRPGDLYVRVEFESHPLYRVSGRDLYLDLPLTPWEPVLGASVRIPTLSGPVEFSIKPGTSAGQRIRIAKRGLPAASGSSGDLYAVVRIDVPKAVDMQERKLYEQLAAISHFNPRQHLMEGGAA